MRIIDADALKQYIDDCEFCNNCRNKKNRCAFDCVLPDYLTSEWERVLDEQPTVDAVPVDFINQKIVELQSCANQHFNDGHEILATCVFETIRLLGSFLKEWRGKEQADDKR